MMTMQHHAGASGPVGTRALVRKTTQSRMRTAATICWGAPDWQRTLAPGVIAYNTPGHGGIIVSTELFDLDPRLREGLWSRPIEWKYADGTVALSLVPFEEDADVTALWYCHPELIEPAVKKHYLGEGFGHEYFVERVMKDDYYARLRPTNKEVN